MNAAPTTPHADHATVYHRPRAEGIHRAAKAIKPDALMWALALMNFTFIWRIQDAFPPLSKIKLSLLAEIGAIILFSIDSHPLRKLKTVQNQPIVRMLALLLTLMILGLPLSLWRGKSFDFIAFDFLPTFLMMFMMGASVRNFKDVEWFAMVNVLGCFMYTGLVNLFMNVGSRSGRLNNLVYYDANDICVLIVATLPIVIYFARPKATGMQKLVALMCLPTYMICFLKAGSRGGFLGIIGVGLFILFQYRAVPAMNRILAVVVAVTLIMTKGSEKFWENMRSLLNPKDDYNLTEESGRKAIWKRGMGYMWSHPLLGVGARAFPQAEGLLSTGGRANTELGAQGFKWSAAHNSFVEVGAETGVIGLCMFTGALLVGIGRMGRIRRGVPRQRRSQMSEVALGQALQGALIGYIISGFFISGAYMAFLYMIYGLIIGVARVTTAPEEQDPGRHAAPPPPPQRRFSGTGRAVAPAPMPMLPRSALGTAALQQPAVG
jgi:O-antigen ligase